MRAKQLGPRDRRRARAARPHTDRGRSSKNDDSISNFAGVSSADRESRENAEVGSRVQTERCGRCCSTVLGATRLAALRRHLLSAEELLARCDAEPSWRSAGRGPRRARERSERQRSPSNVSVRIGALN
jgi:hypothetical protein